VLALVLVALAAFLFRQARAHLTAPARRPRLLATGIPPSEIRERGRGLGGGAGGAPTGVACQARWSASSRSRAAFGLAPTTVCTTSPPL
jgi:hypothetical protein